MKLILIILAIIAFISPLLVWAWLVSLACAYSTSNAPCGVGLADYWDREFLLIAALPWLIGAICLIVRSKLK